MLRRFRPVGLLVWGCLLLPAARPLHLAAQNADVLLNDEVYHLLDRLDIQGRLPGPLPSDLKPYPQEAVAEWLRQAADTAWTTRAQRPQAPLHPQVQAWLHRSRWRLDDQVAQRPDSLRGLRKLFFANRRDLLAWQSPNGKSALYLNPQLYGSLGLDQQDGTQRNLYRNSRGASLRVRILDRVGLYADFTDNQTRLPAYQVAYNAPRQNLLGEGFYKLFKEDGYDFLAARGYATFSAGRWLRIKFGRDRAHWGNGYQSLVLADQAVDHLMLNYTLRFGHFEYHTHLAQMADFIPGKADTYGRFPTKYAVFHRLGWRPDPRLSFGLFEAVVFAPDQPNGRRGFELEYLNPLIFFRTIEQYVGSPDNAVLGLDFKVNALRRLQVYGTVVLDDFNFAEFRNGPNYFGNKYALQAGLKYIDAFGLRMLDLQLEANHIRPFVHSHFNTQANFAHYDQPLAHPLGANLQEVLALVRLRPHHRLELELLAALVRRGLNDPDRPELNFGGDIFVSNLNINNGQANPRFGHAVGQGVEQKLLRLNARLSYQVMLLNLFVDLEGGWRSQNTAGTTTPDAWAQLSLRWMLSPRVVRF